MFCQEVPVFAPPFDGAEIRKAVRPDEVAYFQCRLRTDMLDGPNSQGVYLEVEVLQNPDNLSMAVVDFEAGGCSSVTFSPNTGAVIRERKVREAPRKVEGAYVQPLSMCHPAADSMDAWVFICRAGVSHSSADATQHQGKKAMGNQGRGKPPASYLTCCGRKDAD
jgi:hypothetical protein